MPPKKGDPKSAAKKGKSDEPKKGGRDEPKKGGKDDKKGGKKAEEPPAKGKGKDDGHHRYYPIRKRFYHSKLKKTEFLNIFI